MGNIFRCCGKTGKPAVRAVAYIDLTMAFIFLIGGFLLITAYPGELLPQAAGGQKIASTPNIVSIIMLIGIFFVECCLGAILLSAARNKNPGQCDNWFKIRLIILCISIFALIYVLSVSKVKTVIFVGGGFGLLGILYRVYTLMIVKFFQNEIENKLIAPIDIVQK